MKFSLFPSKLAALVAVLFAAGCTVGPDFQSPAPPAEAGYAPGPLPAATQSTATTLGEAQHFDPAMDVPGEWWTLFHSRPLNDVMVRALKANPSIEAAQAALRAAHENMLAEQGSLFPSLALGASDGVVRTATGTLAATSASGKPEYSLFTGELRISYSVDFFGLNQRRIESVAAQAEMQRFELEAAYLSLTSNVVMAAAQEAGLSAEIAAQQDIVDADSQVTEIIRKQYQLGDAAEADLVQQETMLAAARAQLPPLEKALALQRNALLALTGGFPNHPLAEHFELAALTLPRDLPISLPARLVEQRPDIRAAAAKLHAASADVGVAIASRLPQINLTANLGTASNTIAGAFAPYDQFFSVAGGIAQPLFDGGTLRHRQHAAEAMLDEAKAQYRGTVIGAFRDVADSLRALQEDAKTLQAAMAAERAASRNLDMARAQLKLGDRSYLYVLDAERGYGAARLALVQAQVTRLSDTAALFQALGGGWWNRSDVAEEAGQQSRL